MYPGKGVCPSNRKITSTSTAMPAHPRTKLPIALRMRSAGMSATMAPTPNCHIRPKVTKYAGAGSVIVKTTQNTKDAALTTPSATITAWRRRPRNHFSAIHAASSMMSGHMT